MKYKQTRPIDSNGIINQFHVSVEEIAPAWCVTPCNGSRSPPGGPGTHLEGVSQTEKGIRGRTTQTQNLLDIIQSPDGSSLQMRSFQSVPRFRKA